jgi:hypothetical protein
MADNGVVAGGRLTDWVSLGVLAAAVPRDAVDDAVAAAGKQARRSDGKLPPHVMVYFVMALALFADEDYEEWRPCPARLLLADRVGGEFGPRHGQILAHRQTSTSPAGPLPLPAALACGQEGGVPGQRPSRARALAMSGSWPVATSFAVSGM